MAIDFVGLVALLGVMVYLPFLIIRTIKSGDQKALKHPERTHWLALTIFAGEIIIFGFILELILTFFLPRNQLNQLPVPVQALGLIVVFVGAVAFLWGGMKAGL